VSIFQHCTIFELTTPKYDRSNQNGVPKSVFCEKGPLMEKFQHFARKQFMRTMIHIFLPSFMTTGKTEVTKLVRCIMMKKNRKSSVFGPSLAPLEKPCQKFYGVTLFPLPILCQVSSKSIQFSQRYMQKCFFTIITILA